MGVADDLDEMPDVRVVTVSYNAEDDAEPETSFDGIGEFEALGLLISATDLLRDRLADHHCEGCGCEEQE